MRIREKCYISLGDGKVTVLNEAGEETCLNDFTDKEAQAKDMLLEIKRLLCDFYYVPNFFVVNDFYVYWDSDFDKALMIGDDEPRGICFYDCENMTIPAALRELEKIEMIRGRDRIYRLDHAVTKMQKTILNAFGMDAAYVKKRAERISEQLKIADKIGG